MPKTYEHIAQAIEQHAKTLPDEAELVTVDHVPVHAPVEKPMRTELKVGNLTLRFPASKPAALALAAKYRKGKTADAMRSWRPLKMPSLRAAPFSQTTLDQFIMDGELDNAEQYAALHRREVYYAATRDGSPPQAIMKAEQLKGDPRFIVGCLSVKSYGYVRDAWRVTHIASGLAATRNAGSKQDALAQFRAIPPDKLEQAIAKAPPLRVRDEASIPSEHAA